MNMLFLVNGITIALCMAVIFYCYVLSKNLKAMKDLKNGIGAAITNMTQATEDMSRSFEKNKSIIHNDNEKLRDTIDEGIALTDYLSELIKKANKQTEILEANMQQSYLHTKPQEKQQSHLSQPSYMQKRQHQYFAQQTLEDDEDDEYLDEPPHNYVQNRTQQPLREFREQRGTRTENYTQPERRVETKSIQDSLQRILNEQHNQQQKSQENILRSKMPRRWEQYEGYAQDNLDDVVPKGFENTIRRQRA